MADSNNELEKIMRKGGRPKRKTRKKQNGGLLRGPSHSRGGMPAIIGGTEPVELEGGEYIIRKSSVDKYGEGTIARINQGLVNPNALRQLKKGGPVRKRRGKKMARGGNTCPSGQHWMPARGGRAGYCMQGTTHPGGYRRGGRINRRMQAGGRAGGGLDNKRKTQKIDNKGRKR